MEAHVYVRNGSPWICAVCPKCGHPVYPSEKYCKECGTKIEFNDFYTVSHTRGLNLRSPEWVRYIPNKMENIKNFLYELKKLEKAHHIEETSMVKIMRDAYYNTCADELFKLEGPNEVVSE